MEEIIKQLNIDTHFLECQIQNLFTTLYSILGRQYPGQVLSSLLHRATAGITIGDVITELACEPINVTVLPSLKHGKYFSFRPLVEFLDSSGNITMGQIYRDGNVYKGVKFFEKFIPGRIFTFNINNTFYTFQNYTLTHFEDFNSLLEIISESHIIRNQLSSFLENVDSSSKNSIANPNSLINSSGAMLKNVFL